MSVRIGINGFGRIGRLVVRAALKRGMHVAGVNDLTDALTLAHLFKYDSVHGTYPGEVRAEAGALVIDGTRIPVTSEKDPAALPWKSLEAGIVIESTGRFTQRAGAAKHLAGGAKRVIISAPADDADATFVMGVNHKQFDAKKHQVISCASCTTNCLAPLAYVLHNSFGIERGFMTTVHSYTNDQVVQDAPHKDLRRARAAALSMIPTTTGAARAIGLVLPELKGKLDGYALRVPTPDVSVIDLTVQLKKNTSAEEINQTLYAASESELKGILGFERAPLVSQDFVGDTRSSIIDALSTTVIDGNFAKLVAWYDNEAAYAERVVDLAQLTA